jgi:hypothetical protein
MNRQNLCAGLLFFAAAVAVCAPAEKKNPPLRLFPRLAKGQLLRYQISYHRVSKGRTTSMVQNPASDVSSEVSVSLAIRIEVLEAPSPEPGRADARPAFKLRATYERATGTQRSDDPTVDDRAAEREIARLEGKSFECAIGGDGAAACSAAGDTVPGAADGMQRWLTEAFAAASLPQKGILPGESWSDEQAAGAEIPLAGLRWTRKFRFVGENPCREVRAAAKDGATMQSPGGEVCAEIRVESQLLHRGNKKNATPDAFREKGLRTSGTARGQNESVIRISLATGLTISAGDTAWQAVDFTVSQAKGEGKIRTASEIKSESGLTLVRDAP